MQSTPPCLTLPAYRTLIKAAMRGSGVVNAGINVIFDTVNCLPGSCSAVGAGPATYAQILIYMNISGSPEAYGVGVRASVHVHVLRDWWGGGV